MNDIFKTLRIRLFTWYFLSLVFLGTFIILTIHILQYKYSPELILVALALLSVIGFLIIYRFTRSLTVLSSQMKKVTSRNLETRVSVHGNDEIGELARSFNGLLDRLEIAFRRERQFIGDVAHEMKTPIATLRSSFEVTLKKERTNDEYRQILKDSIKETDRITATLKDILDLAWTEVPNENMRKVFSLSQVMEEMAEIAQKLGTGKKIRVKQDIIAGVNVSGFRERLARAILNIIDNAVKYTPDEGMISISLEKEDGKAVVAVRDSGSGIAPEEIERIFDRFYRGGKSDKVFGAGLGLSIAKSTVEIHKGKIKAVSAPGKGSTFFIILPTA